MHDVEAGIGISVGPGPVVRATGRLSVAALDADFPAHGYGVFAPRGRRFGRAPGVSSMCLLRSPRYPDPG
ncbi:MAG: hypothetical protein OXI15_05090 [Chromatiales bacterium]|nr:hypothetical protein [Chromatiales bacterium]